MVQSYTGPLPNIENKWTRMLHMTVVDSNIQLNEREKKQAVEENIQDMMPLT